MYKLYEPRKANKLTKHHTLPELKAYLRAVFGVTRLYRYSFINGDGATVTLWYPSLRELKADQDGAYAVNSTKDN